MEEEGVGYGGLRWHHHRWAEEEGVGYGSLREWEEQDEKSDPGAQSSV